MEFFKFSKIVILVHHIQHCALQLGQSLLQTCNLQAKNNHIKDTIMISTTWSLICVYNKYVYLKYTNLVFQCVDILFLKSFLYASIAITIRTVNF